MNSPAFDTVWPSDSIEFCPDYARNLLVCGTYKLDDLIDPTPDGNSDQHLKPQQQYRRGKCMLFGVTTSDHSILQKLQEIDLPAVPDMKWCHRAATVSPVLGIADSEGNISVHELVDKELKSVQTISCAPSNVLCLSLDWSNRRAPTVNLGSLVVSMSNGEVSLLQPNDSSGLKVTDTWKAHEYEPWIVCWNYWDTNIIYSGGDDQKLKAWDIRQGSKQPLFVNRRFEAGVTTIQSHPHIEHLIAVGSYDSSVRLFDVRKPSVPVIQANVGGGAWRVKWHPSETRKSDLLVACMHDGFKVIRFAVGELSNADAFKEWEVIKRFDDHQSLAYGVDWSYEEAKSSVNDTLIASGSFYDHALHLWRG